MLNIELKQLEVFHEVVKCTSFSAAGKKLYLSQSTVSMHIKNLEGSLGIKLFDRSSVGTALTAEGKRFYEDVAQILLLIDNAESKLCQAKNGAEGDLVIQMSYTTYTQVLSDIVIPFTKLYPNIRLAFRTSLSPETIENVGNCFAHIGFVRMPVPMYRDPRFDSVLLYEDTSTFIVAPGHPFAKRESITMAEASNEPMLFYAVTTNYWVQVYSVFTQMGLQPSVKMNLDHIGALLEMVGLGMGVSFLPTKTVQDAIKLGKVVAVPVSDCPDMRRYTLAIYKSKNLRYHPLKLFLDFMIQHGDQQMAQALPTQGGERSCRIVP